MFLDFHSHLAVVPPSSETRKGRGEELEEGREREEREERAEVGREVMEGDPGGEGVELRAEMGREEEEEEEEVEEEGGGRRVGVREEPCFLVLSFSLSSEVT